MNALRKIWDFLLNIPDFFMPADKFATWRSWTAYRAIFHILGGGIVAVAGWGLSVPLGVFGWILSFGGLASVIVWLERRSELEAGQPRWKTAIDLGAWILGYYIAFILLP